ncbi:hypothetical protein E4U38_003604 [Claviceps purpurea]|nr:hypothetical protein E4U38_003604 [Claviceps purpurea]
MDTTFRTNKYERQVLNVMSASPMGNTVQLSVHILRGATEEDYVVLKVIVADRELALMNAIDRVFNKAVPNILYERHITNDVQAKLRKMGGLYSQQPVFQGGKVAGWKASPAEEDL